MHANPGPCMGKLLENITLEWNVSLFLMVKLFEALHSNCRHTKRRPVKSTRQKRRSATQKA